MITTYIFWPFYFPYTSDTEYVSWTPNNKINKYYKFSNMSLEDTNNYSIDLQKLPEIAVQEYFYKLNVSLINILVLI